MTGLDTAGDRAEVDAPTLRAARTRDGSEMWRLVRDGDGLELNTHYAYLVMCRDFGDTSLIAERDGSVVGFVLSYRPPHERDVIFVWQIGVAPSARGHGLGGKMLRALIELPGCRGVRFMESTVTPSNQASLNLFSSFARQVDVPIEKIGGFAAEDFQYDTHEPEDRYRIGPFATH